MDLDQELIAELHDEINRLERSIEAVIQRTYDKAYQNGIASAESSFNDRENLSYDQGFCAGYQCAQNDLGEG